MAKRGKKILLAITAIVCIVSIIGTSAFAAGTLNWYNQTKNTRFLVHVASTSLFKKTATITVKNASSSSDRIIVRCISKDSCISGASLSGSFLYIGPGKSRSYSVSVKALKSGLVKFEVWTQSGSNYSYSVTCSGGGYQSMCKCL